MNTYVLEHWTFTSPAGHTHTVATFWPVTESQAREAATRKGIDVTGWTASKGTREVKVATEGDGEAHTCMVTFERTQTCTVEVEAHDEVEATEMAWEKLDGADWDDGDESTPTVASCERYEDAE